MAQDYPLIYTRDSASHLVLFCINAKRRDELTLLRSRDEERDFVFIAVCQRVVMKSGKRSRWDAELGFAKL